MNTKTPPPDSGNMFHIFRQMNPARALCTLALAAVLAGCSLPQVKEEPAPAPSLPYKEGELLLPSGTPVSMQNFLTMTAKADYILIGESHDNPGHHRMQAQLLASLAKAGRRPLLGLEMVSVDRQGALDRFNSSKLTVDTLPEALDWQKSWGFDYTLYRPVFEAARASRAPIYALNVPKNVFNALRSGAEPASLPADERKHAPARIIPPQKAQQEILYRVFAMHGKGMKPKESDVAPASDDKSAAEAAPRNPGDAAVSGAVANPMFARFMRAQSVWDSYMAERAAGLHKRHKRPVVIFAGGGHVEYGYGIAHRLRILDPKARIFLVMPVYDELPGNAPVDRVWRETVPAPPPVEALLEAKLESSKSGDPAAGPSPRTAPVADLLFYSEHKAPRRPASLGLTLAQKEERVLVMAVKPGSRAERAGIKAGQYITRMNDTPVTKLMDLHRGATSTPKEGQTVTVEQDGRETTMTLPGE